MRGKAAVDLIGNVTRDPELRETASGTAVCNFGLAVNDRRDDPAIFLDCTAWGKEAETVAAHVHKGDPLNVEGHLRLHEWEDRQSGEKKSKLVVNVSRALFLPGNGPRATADVQPPPAAPAAPAVVTADAEDIPF